jgi:Tfp pilus tip-associated adhesin PilY1
LISPPPGGFGTLTITKSIAVKCKNTMAGTLASGGINVFVVKITDPADPGKVTISGIDIEGIGTTPGTNGIRVLSATRVNIVDNEVFGFSGAGVDVNPSAAPTKVVVARNHIHDNGIGVMNAPGSCASTRCFSDSQDPHRARLGRSSAGARAV